MSAARALAGVPAGVLAMVLFVALCPIARAAPKSFFGVVPQAPLEAADYPRMAEAHVGLLRLQLNWAAIDPAGAAGDPDWAGTDAAVGDAARSGIRVLPFVFGAPSWAFGRGAPDCGSECPPYPPKGRLGLAAWAGFLADAVDRYGPRGSFWALHPETPRLPIRTWQIWNEQNSPTFFRPRPNVRSYARLLATAHDAITARDPGAKIVLGGMFGNPRGGQKPVIAAADYLARLYRRPGSAEDFDGVAAHPYAARVSEVAGQVELLHDEIERAGDDAGIWITEIGWASGGEPSPLNRGPEGQADRLARTLRYFLANRRRLGIATVDWYSWRDSPISGPALCDWCRRSGLLEEDGTAKPALDAFSDVAGAS